MKKKVKRKERKKIREDIDMIFERCDEARLPSIRSTSREYKY